MKVYYLSSTGHAYLEYVHPKFRMIEFRDGYHTLDSSAIWRTGDRDEEAIVYVWQGRSSPEGQDPTKVRFTMKANNRLRDHRQPIMVSKLWVRWLKMAIVSAIWAIGFIFAGYVVYLIYAASRLS